MNVQVFHPTLNRAAIVVRHKEPFIDWLTSIDQENEYIEMEQDLNCYLVPDFDELDELQDFLKGQFDNIFRNELNDWYTDQELWPENRSFEVFQEWFAFNVHATVFDLTESELSRTKVD